ncbi:hypothetical protein BP5796_02473 [Coleophoma crateriformis]|uniref:Uncharacterized protein n=1 Tax=Coleophoma crateriformis TaxID=565419 RepID=A0A3D8SZX5_9HELO|nr:hypothetical protein BP5796_02473 [Coleophoma crateriformis]
MSPPPVTPSPHRFLVKKQALSGRAPPVQEQSPHRPSSQQIHSTPRPSTQQSNYRPSAQQFNATPRFAFSSTPRHKQDVPASTPAAPRFVTPARPVLEADKLIEPSSDDLVDVHDSIELDDEVTGTECDLASEEDDYAADLRTPKRRRLSLSQTPVEHAHNEESHPSSASSFPILSSPPVPPAPRHTAPSAAPRFKHATPVPVATQSLAGSQQPTFSRPPRFRPPDPTVVQASVDPLPEQFSPHRRGQKYLAGGLAAEAQHWLINIGAAIPGSEAQKKKDDPWAIRVLVDEISGGSSAGMTLICGKQVHVDNEGGYVADNSQVAKIVLAGEAILGSGLQRSRNIETGLLVGIKGPMWEIVLEGERWSIGVGWQVLP